MTQRVEGVVKPAPMVLAMGHCFDEGLRCDPCRVHFETHQRTQKRCEKPKRECKGGRPKGGGKEYTKTCPACGVEFITRHGNAINCSRRCSATRKRARAQDRDREKQEEATRVLWETRGE